MKSTRSLRTVGVVVLVTAIALTAVILCKEAWHSGSDGTPPTEPETKDTNNIPADGNADSPHDVRQLDMTPLGRRLDDWWKAVARTDIGRIREVSPGIVAAVAAESPRTHGKVLQALTHKYAQSKASRSECQLAIVAAMLAELHRHVATNAGQATGDHSAGSDTLPLSALVAGAKWTLTALSHIAKADAPPECRPYFANRTPDLLALHVWFTERLQSSDKAPGASEQILAQLGSLASVASRPEALRASLVTYRKDIEALSAAASGSAAVRELIGRYVAAYNAKDTAELRTVFADNSSANRQLRKRTANEIISAAQWMINKFTITRITVHGETANIDMDVQYQGRDGALGGKTTCSFRATKGADDAWKLE